MFKLNGIDVRKLRCPAVKMSLELFDKKFTGLQREKKRYFFKNFPEEFQIFEWLGHNADKTVCRAGLRTGSQETWFSISGKAVRPEWHTPPLWASVSSSG